MRAVDCFRSCIRLVRSEEHPRQGLSRQLLHTVAVVHLVLLRRHGCRREEFQPQFDSGFAGSTKWKQHPVGFHLVVVNIRHLKYSAYEFAFCIALLRP